MHKFFTRNKWKELRKWAALLLITLMGSDKKYYADSECTQNSEALTDLTKQFLYLCQKCISLTVFKRQLQCLLRVGYRIKRFLGSPIRLWGHCTHSRRNSGTAAEPTYISVNSQTERTGMAGKGLMNDTVQKQIDAVLNTKRISRLLCKIR